MHISSVEHHLKGGAGIDFSFINMNEIKGNFETFLVHFNKFIFILHRFEDCDLSLQKKEI